MADVLPALQKKLNLQDDDIKDVRIYEAHGGKVYKELTDDFNVAGVNEFVVLYAEKIPDEEVNAAADDRAVYCYHFDKEPTKPHGVPFKFMIKPSETFKDTRERIGKRTGIKGKNLEKIKFAVVSRTLYSKPRYLEDGKSCFLLCSPLSSIWPSGRLDCKSQHIYSGTSKLICNRSLCLGR